MLHSIETYKIFIYLLLYFCAGIRGLGTREAIWMKIIEPKDVGYIYRLRPAKDFGYWNKFNFQMWDMILTSPEHACTKQLQNGLDLHGNIALIKRGECSFLTKVYNAEMYGAVAVIIYNHKIEDDDTWIDMIGDGTERNSQIGIPAFFLRGKDGKKIVESLHKHSLSNNAVVNLPVNISDTVIPLNQPPWELW